MEFNETSLLKEAQKYGYSVNFPSILRKKAEVDLPFAVNYG